MSLDIYATIDGKVKYCEALDSMYRLWSRKDLQSFNGETNEVLHLNITHNLGEMASKIDLEWLDTSNDFSSFGKLYQTDLYHLLWRPEEVFENEVLTLEKFKQPLLLALDKLLKHEADLEQYNSEDGYGHYTDFLYILPMYIRACYKWSDAVVKVSR